MNKAREFDFPTEIERYIINKKDTILTFMLALSILGSIAMLIYIIVTPQIGERFTEFYILGKNGKAADYPKDLKNGESGTVIVGVVNHEYQLTNYVLEIRLAGDLLINDKIMLEHNKTYEKIYQIVLNKNGTNMKLEFLLFREDNSTPYRNLYLWVNVTPSET